MVKDDVDNVRVDFVKQKSQKHNKKKVRLRTKSVFEIRNV